MKLEKVWNQYKDYTEIASKTARTLALGAIAICWFFRSQATPLSPIEFPLPIKIALVLLIAFFLLDLLQSCIAAVVVRHHARKNEIRLYNEWKNREGKAREPAFTADTEIPIPPSMDSFATRAFMAKMTFLLLAYLAIGSQFVLL